ncbi:YbaN family protein [Sneathiella chinensis]|uniref:DUF454 domain-containing protein n=1 Tax=Sneathiella chinensis TaxID=349750 RepID=A0ABQ5U2Y7_9PROT|nr:YbaN family protein [Sneathiella chinensis]GLQ06284.1 hypothetical protein GCM10007924_15050 [Sneathiella chinensis]
MTRQGKKYLLLGLGFFFVALGGLGVVLPVLPTTPFLLIALWAFSQSSNRFHDWLYTHRIFGPPLQEWSEYGVIPLRAKIVTVTTMATSAILVFMFSDVPWWGLASMLALMLVGAGFVLSRPSHRKSDEPIN